VLALDRRVLSPQPMAMLADVDQPDRPFGALTDSAVAVGAAACQHVPELASGELEIVALARTVGLRSKVAIRQRLRSSRRQPGPFSWC
jgi:hypothetical protein